MPYSATRCSLCYTPLDTDPEQFQLTEKTTVTLCTICSDQADQISANTGTSKTAAINYLIDLILTSLTTSCGFPSRTLTTAQTSKNERNYRTPASTREPT